MAFFIHLKGCICFCCLTWETILHTECSFHGSLHFASPKTYSINLIWENSGMLSVRWSSICFIHTYVLNCLVVFPTFFHLSLNLAIRRSISWATVSSQSSFCWLHRVSPCSAAENKTNLILVLTDYWVMSVYRALSCVVGRGCACPFSEGAPWNSSPIKTAESPTKWSVLLIWLRTFY